jgi:hypothetical protein
MMDLTGDLPTLQSRYGLCRTGLALLALACGVMSFDSLGNMLLLLTWRKDLHDFFTSPDWYWLAGTTIVWSSLVGSVLLAGRWPQAHWRRRVVLLVLTSLAGVVLWAIRHAVRLGLSEGEPPLEWERLQITLAVRWAWLVVLISLAGDVAEHLGRSVEALPLRAMAQALLSLGVAVWLVLMLTRWGARGAPPPRVLVAVWMQWLCLTATRAGTCFATTLLALLAARECSRVLRELRHAADADPFATPP